MKRHVLLVALFAYLSKKDLVLEFYLLDLAQQLFHDKSSSNHAERLFIVRLKEYAGIHLTSKLKEMIKDVQRSKDT